MKFARKLQGPKMPRVLFGTPEFLSRFGAHTEGLS